MAAHPRVCGEHGVARRKSDTASGSSPRVRGTCWDWKATKDERGLIPACAGNMYTWRLSSAIMRAHPRVCGEHRRPVPLPAPASRLIPACAGNIPPTALVFGPPTAHPRVCGEHSEIEPQIVAKYGSSPRVRGTLINALDKRDASRLIPACAGNMLPAGPELPAKPAHPRVCGEHRLTLCANTYCLGSSPRVRGTFSGAGPGACIFRLIPACAGNILRWSRH